MLSLGAFAFAAPGMLAMLPPLAAPAPTPAPLKLTGRPKPFTVLCRASTCSGVSEIPARGGCFPPKAMSWGGSAGSGARRKFFTAEGRRGLLLVVKVLGEGAKDAEVLAEGAGEGATSLATSGTALFTGAEEEEEEEEEEAPPTLPIVGGLTDFSGPNFEAPEFPETTEADELLFGPPTDLRKLLPPPPGNLLATEETEELEPPLNPPSLPVFFGPCNACCGAPEAAGVPEAATGVPAGPGVPEG